MRRFLFFFLFASICAHAEWDHLFSEDEDPSLFHHVNVITGNLNLCLQDGVVQGAKSIPLFRTYSSAGALERSRGDVDWKLRDLRGFLIQGGWSFFPHANLLIEIDGQMRKMKAFLPEKSGNLLAYSYVHERKGGDRFLKPKLAGGQCSGNLSARTNPRNNVLRVNVEKGTATLFLPDGGSRTYIGEKLKSYHRGNRRLFYYRLETENLASGHQIRYRYNHRDQIKEIAAVNLNATKTYALARFDLLNTEVPFEFQIKTSDGKHFAYNSIEFKDRDYLSSVSSNARPSETSHYAPGRKGTGARIQRLERDGKLQFQVNYYLPPDHKTDVKWHENPDKKDFSADKVSSLEAPLGANGEMVSLGRFFYSKEYTDVRDAGGILTRYFHDGEKLTRIEYFDEKEKLYSAIKFLWENEKLRCKIKTDAKDDPLYAKTFQYDDAGNVTEETLWGNLTGSATGTFSLKEGYSFSGAESLRKCFSYNAHFNTPSEEKEEDGPTTLFYYKPGTDLLTLKLTCSKAQILKREIFEYDADHLLIAEIIDDGTSSDPNDLTGLTLRQIKRYTLDPASGLAKTVREFFYDLESGSERLLKRIELTYSPENLVRAEAIYDATNTYRYTLTTDYEKGRIIRKTTPLGHENTYRYDPFGNLLESKEVGSHHKIYEYDKGGRPFSCTERDDLGTEKISKSAYDVKGRLRLQVDTRGNATEQTYDVFGRCLQTEFPVAKNEDGEVYRPTAHFSYDVQGNLISTTIAQGETTQTRYNTFRKPVEITHADGTKILHTYNKNGTLCKTIYPDETEIHYTYDLFQRMTFKTVVDKSGEELSKELWEYNTFHLLSHTDTRGLTTRFAYDGAGRKISEEAEGRKKSFVYDALGFLERTIEGEVSHIQICDVEGQVVEEWIEEASGRTENWMRFSYNAEGRKEKAIRLTSQGEAVDLFAYDGEGRLTRHTDPHGEVTQFLFSEVEKNDLGQRVQQRSVIDALGNVSIETCDALNRLAKVEKREPQGKVVSREEYLYDRAGNRAKRITSVFEKNELVKQISASWEYDSMGRIVKEVEDEKKVTTFTYDEKGRVKTRTLADGTVLSHVYDGIDRLKELKSSDGTIHLRYFYRLGNEPTEIQDLVSHMTLQRSYNLFGELVEETSSAGMHYNWEHDNLGRITKFTLPDHSAVAYAYAGNHLVSVERKSAKAAPLYRHRYLHFDENGHVSEESIIHDLGGIRTTRDLLERPISFTSLWLHHRISYGPTNLVKTTKNSLFGEKTYTHDALNQVEREGDKTHAFDSVGNPAHCGIERCNQITSFEGSVLIYDEKGNPLERISTEGKLLYTYDALGRLTSITQPETRRVRFLYDPLSRLLAKEVSLYKNGKWKEESPIFYLYDQETEIGTSDASGKIRELKVLGLGIRGEIGAAVAVEVGGKAFAPLHDFQGNIIALVSSDGEISESYELSAFGEEKFSSQPLNPWRFSSKRSEENLIFFGKRFYDPSLKRWLTPDPSGFADGPNLYVFVLNSPLSRLDLFGLMSESQFPELQINVPINRLISRPNPRELIHCKGFINGVPVDWITSCAHWHRLQFTAEEEKTGIVNIVNHMHELVQKEGPMVGLITAQNGILTNLDDFSRNMCRSIRDKTPEGTLFIGIHLPTEGFFTDVGLTKGEIYGRETAAVCTTRQILGALVETLHKINPEALWLHVVHSRGGVVGRNAIAGLPPEQKALLQQHLYILAFAPAQPIPRDYGFRVSNIFSMEDRVTGWSGLLKQFNKTEYDISYIPSSMTAVDLLMFRSEHGIMSKTYNGAMKDRINRIRKSHGFYNEAVR